MAGINFTDEREYAPKLTFKNNDAIHNVSGSASDFEKDLFKLINNYCKEGLQKPDLVKKMEWVLGSCKMS